MDLEFFDGAQWRPISEDEAKYRHAEGQGDRLRRREVDDESPPAQGDEQGEIATDDPAVAPATPPPSPPTEPKKPRR